MPASPESLFLMGRCGRAHGVRGEVKVFPETDDPGRFADLDRVFVGERAEGAREHEVVGVRYQPQKGRTIVLLRLSDVETRDAAEALRGLAVFAAEDDLPPLEDGEVYLHDLVGLAAWTVGDDGEAGEEVGVVREVLDGTAQPLLVVARDGRPDVLVPDVPEIVVEVDLGAGRILLDPPEGLLD